MAEVTPSLKKEAVEALASVHQKCVAENGRSQDRTTSLQQLSR